MIAAYYNECDPLKAETIMKWNPPNEENPHSQILTTDEDVPLGRISSLGYGGRWRVWPYTLGGSFATREEAQSYCELKVSEGGKA